MRAKWSIGVVLLVVFGLPHAAQAERLQTTLSTEIEFFEWVASADTLRIPFAGLLPIPPDSVGVTTHYDKSFQSFADPMELIIWSQGGYRGTARFSMFEHNTQGTHLLLPDNPADSDWQSATLIRHTPPDADGSYYWTAFDLTLDRFDRTATPLGGYDTIVGLTLRFYDDAMAVPEPSTLVLLALVLVGLVSAKRQSRSGRR